jgi:hypothetical protein
MARAKVQEIEIDYWRHPIRPQASPVDAYVRPPTPEKSNLWQLAESLGQLDRSLGSFLQGEKTKQEANDKLQGEAQAWKDSSYGDSEGVKRGLIPPQASPAFRQGYGATIGILAGEQLQRKWDSAYLAWPGKDSASPEQFDAFFTDFVGKNIGTNDPDQLRTLMPRIRTLADSAYRKWQVDLGNATYGRRVVAEAATMGQAIDTHVSTGDYAALAREIETQRQQATGSGIREDDFDKEFVDVIVAKSVEKRDPKLLNLLDRTVPGRDHTYSDAPYGRGKKAHAVDQIETATRRELAEADRLNTKLDKNIKDDTTRAVIDLLVKDPRQPLPDELLEQGSRVDPEFKKKALDWQEHFIKSDGKEDPTEITRLYSEIMDGGGTEAVRRALSSGVLRNRESISAAWSFAEKIGKEDTKKVLQGGTVQAIEGAIRERTKPDKFEQFFNPSNWSDAGLAAWTEYQRLLVDWYTANPNASLGEIMKAQGEIGQAVLSRINRPESGQPTFQRQPENPPNPFAPPSQATPTPRPRPNVEADQWFNNLAPDARDAIRNRAIERNIPFEQYRDRAFEVEKQRPALEQQQQRERLLQQQGVQQSTGQSPAAPSAATASLDVPGVGRIELHGVTPEGMQQLNGMLQKSLGMFAPRLQATTGTAKALNGPVLELPNGLGRADLSGLSPEQQKFVQDNIPRFLPGARVVQPQAQSPAAPGRRSDLGTTPDGTAARAAALTASEPVSARRVAQIDASPVKGLVEKVAAEHGMEPSVVKAIVSIESSGRANARTGSYKGLLQLSDAEFETFGDGGDIYDPEDNLRAGIRSLQSKAAVFAREFGRQPTVTELYLMHQQGEAGLRSHERNLDKPAWQNMLATGEGRRKGERWAKAAIWGNVPKDFRRAFGSVENVTSREFIAMWTAKLQGISFEQALALINNSKTTRA